MSRLRELRLHGFKTFADPTRFVFEPGVNAVIGPNGSGKSNMADAVRWVMGEQSNRSLRTRRADDVIFAGSDQRKPQGMAEAILTLDNEDGWLPIDFAEVTIGRRAYRSGESEYLVNGARARLKDVVELLGEGRLGATELVVVGQGTVDAALSLRPEERRQLFEEAAGVKNLQVRKNEGLARLAKARDNLVRVTDLIGELRPQVRRLAAQAQHQQEHDVLVRRARTLVTESHRRREASARGKLGDARRRAAAAEAALEELRGGQAASREAISAAEERYWQAEAAAREAATAREATREERVRAEGRLEAIAGRVADLERAQRDARQALESAHAALGDHATGRIDADAETLLRTSAEAEAAWRSATDKLAAADASLLAAEEELAEARRQQGEHIAAAARAGELAARSAARREQLIDEVERARAGSRDAAAAIETAALAAKAATERVAQAVAAHEAALSAVADLEPQADAARRSASELAERVGAMRGELEALHERAEQGSRLGTMLSAAGWPALLDALSAPDESWPAIEAVVGGELEQALLWRDDGLLDRLLEARGSARLLVAGGGAGSSSLAGEREAALEAVAGTRTLAEWVGDGAPRILARVAVARDLAALLAGWRTLPAGWVAVTAEGDLADARGLVAVRGRADAPAGESARRHARRRELSATVDRLEAEQAEAASDAARQMAAVTEAGRRLVSARQGREEAERAAGTALSQLNVAEDRARRDAERLRGLEQELSEIADPPIAAGSQQNGADGGTAPDLGGLEERAMRAREERTAAASEVDAVRVRWQQARGQARSAEDRVAGQRREQTVLQARIAQLEAEMPSRAQSMEQLSAEQSAATAAAEAARTADERLAAERASAEASREQARASLQELERGTGDGVARLMELERDAQGAAIDVSRHEELLASLARERELALESLPAETGEAGEEEAVGVPGADRTAAAEIAALSDEAIEADLRRVRRTLAQIGSVNPFAVEEHRELAGRLEELTTQDSDLSAAIGSTEELIARLEADIGQQFDAAFAAIGERFDEFCRLLFAGGSASLHVGDGSDGEAPGGIEIVVRPPGKRLQRLAMLSGGERALTGVALLFAMLSVNPVPFCILDEVDAALDEANIGRFAQALRKLSESIDFVVITHNRATIEVADTIYGVTMTDAAVSRTVSLRLADLPAESLVG